MGFFHLLGFDRGENDLTVTSAFYISFTGIHLATQNSNEAVYPDIEETIAPTGLIVTEAGTGQDSNMWSAWSILSVFLYYYLLYTIYIIHKIHYLSSIFYFIYYNFIYYLIRIML